MKAKMAPCFLLMSLITLATVHSTIVFHWDVFVASYPTDLPSAAFVYSTSEPEKVKVGSYHVDPLLNTSQWLPIPLMVEVHRRLT